MLLSCTCHSDEFVGDPTAGLCGVSYFVHCGVVVFGSQVVVVIVGPCVSVVILWA